MKMLSILSSIGVFVASCWLWSHLIPVYGWVMTLSLWAVMHGLVIVQMWSTRAAERQAIRNILNNRQWLGED